MVGQAEDKDRTKGAWVSGCSKRKDILILETRKYHNPGQEVLWPESQSLMRYMMQTWPTEGVMQLEVTGRHFQKQPP